MLLLLAITGASVAVAYYVFPEEVNHAASSLFWRGADLYGHMEAAAEQYCGGVPRWVQRWRESGLREIEMVKARGDTNLGKLFIRRWPENGEGRRPVSCTACECELAECPGPSGVRFYGVTIALDGGGIYPVELNRRWDYYRAGNVLFTRPLLEHWLSKLHGVEPDPEQAIRVSALDSNMEQLTIGPLQKLVIGQSPSDAQDFQILGGDIEPSDLPPVERPGTPSPGWTIEMEGGGNV